MNARTVYQYEQPRCPDGWNESERRFYARLIQVLDDIYGKYGRIDEKMLSHTVINRIDTVTEKTFEKITANIIEAQKITTDTLEATYAYLMSVTAKYGSFDFATVQNLIAQGLVIEKGQGDYVHITNFAATYGQMVNATIGNLVIKSSDGGYYRLDIAKDGTVKTELVAVSDEEILAGATSSGQPIVATSISAESLDAETVAASLGLFNKITAELIDVDMLVSREAFIASLSGNEAFIDKLFANEATIGHLTTTDISSNTYIQQAILNYATGEIEKYVRLKGDGLHVGDASASNEVVIDEGGVTIVVSGGAFSRFAADYAKFGDYMIRRTIEGGLAFMKGR